MNAAIKGCTQLVNANGATCNKVCDPGQDLCPHHILLRDSKKPAGSAPAPEGARRYKTPRAYSE